ncbi:hypothetical protein EAG_09513 [Camponotus floridanus]|uniref:Uncharacterized protein n=1 Tax=Camponotus floridanus TaxID=104421 RepID=E1ZZ81_CAMFO|nr:hypothetical protein EAG_09513 [Camponotus floridanus]
MAAACNRDRLVACEAALTFLVWLPPLETSRLPDENIRQEIFPLDWRVGFFYTDLNHRKHGGVTLQANFESEQSDINREVQMENPDTDYVQKIKNQAKIEEKA